MTPDPATPEGREELRRLLTGEVPIYEWRSRAAQALAATSAMLDALDAKDAETEQLKQEKANLLIASQRLALPHPARDLAGEHKQLIAAKDAEIERLKTKLTSYVSGVDSQHEEITRLTAKLAAAERCLSNAWVDYDANPYQMATDEYDRQATGTLVVDATGEKHLVYQLGANGAKAAIGVSHDYWREKDRADHLEDKLAKLRDGIAEVIHTKHPMQGYLRLSGREYDADVATPLYRVSPAGAKLAQLWMESQP